MSFKKIDDKKWIVYENTTKHTPKITPVRVCQITLGVLLVKCVNNYHMALANQKQNGSNWSLICIVSVRKTLSVS